MSTERKQAEEALRKSEERFRTLADNISQLCWMANSDGWIFWYNKRWYEYTGTTPKQMEGWGWQSVHDPEALPKVLHQWKESIATGKPFDMVFPLRGADGIFRPFLTRVMPVFNENGQVVHWFGTNTDMTERKGIEEERRQLSQQLSYHVDNSPLAVIEWGPDMRLIRWSGAAEHIFGWKSEEVLGKRMDDFRWIYVEDAAQVSEVSEELQTGSNPRRVSANRNYRKDGTVVDCEWYNSSLLDESGKLLSILSLVLDVTERKRTENALRESERRLAEIVERSPAFVCILRGPEHVFELANEKYFQLVGRRDIIGKKLIDALPEVANTPYPQILDEILQTCEPFSAHDVSLMLARGKDGQLEEVWLDFIYLPLREADSSVCGVFVHGIDITERKKSEERIRKLNEDLVASNEELKVANKEMESFVYSISHDLRSPLRAISGFSSMLFQGSGDCLDDKKKNYLNRIQLGASKMSQLIDDLLRLSHVSRQEMNRIDVNLSSAAAAVIAELRESNPDRKVDIRIGEDISAFADPGLIKIVLSNLLGNAWKFTSKTENAQIEFVTVNEGGQTVYCVRDNGAGFNQGYADKIFRPFHRLHRSDEFEGTGIGLSIVDRIIHRHGGKIWAEGEENKGATVCFALG